MQYVALVTVVVVITVAIMIIVINNSSGINNSEILTEEGTDIRQSKSENAGRLYRLIECCKTDH